MQFLLPPLGIFSALQGSFFTAGVAAATLGGYMLFCAVMTLLLEHASCLTPFDCKPSISWA